MATLSKTYDFKAIEEKWYQKWIDEGCFCADANDDGVPDILKASKKQNNVRKEELAVGNTVKAQAFQGRGPVSEFVLLIMEIIAEDLKLLLPFFISKR